MKKILAVLVALVVMLSTVSAFAYTYDPTGYNYYNNNYNNYNNYGYNNYGYGYNNGYNGYGYCTGMRMNYNDAEYQPSYWFNTYAEQYGIVFHLMPTMMITRNDVFAPFGKAMNKAYEDNGRTFSNNYGVPFVDFTWDPELYTIAGGLYQRGIMIGYPEDNTVRFGQNITRGELAKVLVLVAKQNGIYNGYSNINMTFNDTVGHWAEQYIAECNAMGLMVGMNQYEFAPDQYVTYEQFLAVIIRMAERANNSSYSIDIEDVAYGITTTMDIDFEGYDFNQDFTLSAYGSKTVYLKVGETKTITVKATPSDIELKKSDIDWETNKSGYLKLGNDYVEDDRYVSIDIKALKEGRITLTAMSSKDEDECVNFAIVVSDEEYDDDETYVTSITLNPTAVNLKVGESKTITATVKPSNATNKGIIWVSHNENVATVNANGKITAVGVGNTTIEARAEDGSGVVATIDVVVTAGSIANDDTTAPVVEFAGADNVSVGQKVTLTVTVNESNLANFEIKENDILGLTGGASINKINKVSNNTYEITLMGVEVSSLALCIDAGVATDLNGNSSAQSNEVIIFVNSGENF